MQREVRNQASEAVALNNIGTMYLSLGSYDEAKTYLQQAVTIRERINAPSEMADTLHNLAEVSVKTGAFETALGQYLKALDVRRQVGDKRAAAIELYNLGTLFEYQGRYGAAVQSKAEAVKIFRELNDRGVWLPKVLAAYGSALAQAGRFEEARRLLGEALPIARALKNDELIAQIVTSQGDVLYYQGDFGGARREVPGGRHAHHASEAPARRGRLAAEPCEDRDEGRKVAFTGRNAQATGRRRRATRPEIRVGRVRPWPASRSCGRSDTRRRVRSSTDARAGRAAGRSHSSGAGAPTSRGHACRKRPTGRSTASFDDGAATAGSDPERRPRERRRGGPHPAALGLEADSPGYRSLSSPTAPTRSEQTALFHQHILTYLARRRPSVELLVSRFCRRRPLHRCDRYGLS